MFEVFMLLSLATGILLQLLPDRENPPTTSQSAMTNGRRKRKDTAGKSPARRRRHAENFAVTYPSCQWKFKATPRHKRQQHW
ncbi:MAG: hypothetical protein C0616_00120 [Desulfuromonas sp.]|nr:MAG: hypothetical protein C0616_00120 [Desulfuromonas sp.]